MRNIQSGQNSPIAGTSVVVSVNGEPPDDFSRKTRAGAFLLTAAAQARERDDFISDDNLRSAHDAVTYDPIKREFKIALDALAASVERIAIVLSIRAGMERGATFGTFAAIKTQLADANSTPQLEFSLPLGGRGETAMILAELYRYKGQWKFRAIGQGFSGGLAVLARHYGLTISEPVPDPAPVPRPAPDVSANRRQRGEVFSGTGFCVNAEGYFVTNHHVVEGALEIRARSPRNQYHLQHVFSDPLNDLALLKSDTAANHTAVFRDGTQARLGENVIVIGYPLRGLLGSSPQVTTGNVSSLIGIRDDTRSLQFTAPVQSGNSGGPLLDSDGAVVGVVCAKLDAARIHELTGDIPQNVNFAIKSALVRSFLEAVGVDYACRSSGSARLPAEIAREAQDFVVRIECQG